MWLQPRGSWSHQMLSLQRPKCYMSMNDAVNFNSYKKNVGFSFSETCTHANYSLFYFRTCWISFKLTLSFPWLLNIWTHFTAAVQSSNSSKQPRLGCVCIRSADSCWPCRVFKGRDIQKYFATIYLCIVTPHFFHFFGFPSKY